MSISSTVKTMLFASVAFTGLAGVVASNGVTNLFLSDVEKNAVVNKKEQPKSYIVQGKGSETLKTAVNSIGGSVSREFPIINAISAVMTPSQADVIAKLDNVRIQDDRSVATMQLLSGPIKESFTIDNYIATQVGADKLHELGLTGKGVTVAVLDSGMSIGSGDGKHILVGADGQNRVFEKYDAIQSITTRWMDDDWNGHGTHVSGIIASSLKDKDTGKYNGIAPDVYLMSVKAFDENGQSSYSKVLDGLNYVYQNHARYNIRVLNMSLGSDVRSNYWDDPINQAVMKLWEAGVVVVTSAGNSGHNDMSITVPGNNPYIITVGAITDSYTPFDYSDDRVTTFSSTGPTVEGFVKPEVVAYGGHIASKLDTSLATAGFNDNLFGKDYHEVSGTSQASAVVSGVVALMLQHNPSLTPDDVKCRIISSAKVATNTSGQMAFSPFEQGHGMVDAYAAVTNTNVGCANRGLNISADLAGVTHFEGPARKQVDGTYTIHLSAGVVLTEGNQWGDASIFAEGNQWGDASIFAEGHQWGDAGVFSEGNQWGDSGIFVEGNQWGDAGIYVEGNQWGDSSVTAEVFSSLDAEAEANIIVKDGQTGGREWWIVDVQAVAPVQIIF